MRNVSLKIRQTRSLSVCAASLLLLCSCGSREQSVEGTVLVDGSPLEAGTISFMPVERAASKGSGAMVNQGAFELGVKLTPGRYTVSVEGFKETGKMIADPQRGQVAEKVQLKFRQESQVMEVTSENSQQIVIELDTLPSSRRG